MPEQIEQLQQFAAANNLIPTSTDKPEVLIPGDGISILEASERIYQAIKPSGRFCMRYQTVAEIRENSRGEVEFNVLSSQAARSVFEEYVRFVKRKQNATLSTILSKDLAEAILKTSKASEILPHIDYVSNTPVIVEENGQIQTISGLNERHCLYAKEEELKFPDSLEMAIELIKVLVSDYKFMEESDKSRAIAAILTPALTKGGLIAASPAIMIEADYSQAGKGYLVKLISSIYREEPRIITQKSGGVGSFDESLGMALFSGSTFILLDNLRDNLNSMYLESILTANGSITVRIPYQPEVKVDSRRRMIFLTSNGLQLTDDMVNRLCTIRIKKDFDLQPIKIEGQDMLTVAQGQQAAFLGAIAMVIQEWHRQGKQRTNENRHSFRDWAQSLDWIVQNLFKLPPLLDNHGHIGERLSNANLAFLEMLSRNMAALCTPGTEYRAGDLAQTAQAYQIPIPGLGKDNQGNAEAGAKQIGWIMKSVFDNKNDVSTEYGVWHREQKRQENPNGGKPFESWVYTFQAKTAIAQPPLPPNPMAGK